VFHVAKSFEFSAAHHNANADGPCSKNHGHNWEVLFIFSGKMLDNRAWLVGFDEIRMELKPLVDSLDHQDLNEVLPFNPSSENIAAYLWCEALARMELPPGVELTEVRVTERSGDWRTYASYTP
jgi:6-pyruvoyltetrahydropterin/6-carboxytetrahydropterin synthase